MKQLLFIVPAVSALLAIPSMGLDWPFDGNGFEIVIAEEASSAEKFAAEELQTYFERQSGQKIEIRAGAVAEGKKAIILGRHTANEDLWKGLDNPDHYVVDASDERLRIVGGYRPSVTDSKQQVWAFDWGVAQGAYSVLHEQGVRWYRPGPEGEHVPKRERLVVANGVRKVAPVFPLRWGIAPFATPTRYNSTPEQSAAARLWSFRNGANTNLSIDSAKFGGSWQVAGGHAYQYIVPQSLFEEHPEYFALVNGERVKDKQICHSNPALQDHFVSVVKANLAENPQLSMRSIDPNDHAGWCECEGCTAWDDPTALSGRGGGRVTMSNRIYRFNKIIAERVGEEYPDVTLYCLAYSQYTEAPTIVKDFPKNLRVGITPFHTAFSDWSRPLKDPESVQNSRVVKAIEGFQQGGLSMYAREYFSFYDYYGWPGPLPMLRMMQDRLRVYREVGMDGVCSETHPCWGPQGLDLWMALQLLKNPDLNLEEELRDYCRNYYGPAAESMLLYHKAIEERGSEGIYYGSGGVSAHNLFTNDFLARLKPLAEKAAAEVEGVALYEKRTNAVLEGYHFARLYRDTENAIEAGDVALARKALKKLEHLLCDEYPDGTVFMKGIGRTRKDKHGEFVPSRVVATLEAKMERIASAEKQFEGAKLAQLLNEGWQFTPDTDEKGREEEWFASGFDDSQWSRLRAGEAWQRQGFTNHHGTAWYRRAFVGPVPKERERLLLVFEAVDGDAEVWLNGVAIGMHRLYDEEDNLQWDDPFHFDITPHLKPNERNEIAVRVRKETGVGGIHRSVKLLLVPAGQ